MQSNIQPLPSLPKVSVPFDLIFLLPDPSSHASIATSPSSSPSDSDSDADSTPTAVIHSPNPTRYHTWRRRIAQTNLMSKPSNATRNATRRLLKELEAWNRAGSRDDEAGIERLGPPDEDELFVWEAVINGRGVGVGYDGGRWLLHIAVPPTYPLAPPTMRFVTPVVHANVALDSGEICLDLLKDAWTPAYSLLECVRAVRMLLSCPGVDSPLNVDLASLLRQGDALAARRLVEWRILDDGGRYEGV